METEQKTSKQEIVERPTQTERPFAESEASLEKLNSSEQKAYKLIAEDDPTGQKRKIFVEAIEHSRNKEPVSAEVPIYHSTGSYGLAKILETGAVSSKLNSISGEKLATGEQVPTTSFVIGGYGQSEIVSYFYARKNENKSLLMLDKSDVTGTSCEEDIVSQVFKEIPSLKPDEKEMVRRAIAELKGDRKIGDQDLMDEKLKDLRKRKYYLDEGRTRDELKGDEILLELTDKKTDKYWEIKKEIEKLTKILANYDAETEEMKKELTNPFPVILTFEGKNLPEKDLKTLVGGLVSERRTEQPILNSDLREIRVPKIRVEKVKEWITRRIAKVAEGSEERKALEAVRITPLEFFEAEQIVRDFQPNPSSENIL